MYDIKNLNIWKASSDYSIFRCKDKVLETDVSKRRGTIMSEKCQNVFEEMSMLVPSARFENGKFRFPVYINERLSKASIDELDLSVRSSNCLHRAGYQTIGQLVESIEGFEDLKRIRNCGAKSVNEIMEKLFCYQYCQLDTQQKRKYIQKVVEYNKGY